MANKNEDLIQALTEALSQANKNVVSDKESNVVAIEIQRQVNERAARQQNYANRISDEMNKGINCTKFAIPKIYHQYQPSFVITINGCTVKIPADGSLGNDFTTVKFKTVAESSCASRISSTTLNLEINSYDESVAVSNNITLTSNVTDLELWGYPD